MLKALMRIIDILEDSPVKRIKTNQRKLCARNSFTLNGFIEDFSF